MTSRPLESDNDSFPLREISEAVDRAKAKPSRGSPPAWPCTKCGRPIAESLDTLCRECLAAKRVAAAKREQLVSALALLAECREALQCRCGDDWKRRGRHEANTHCELGDRVRDFLESIE